MGEAQRAAAWEVPAEVNLYDLVLRSTAAAGEHLAIVDLSRDARREWTYARLRAAVAGLAGWLRRNGITDDDDVVVVLTENSAEFVVAYHGILAAGGVVLALDPRDTADHWRATIDTSGAKALIAETALKPPESALPVVCVGATTPGGTAWEDAVAGAPAPARPSGGGPAPVQMI